MLLEIVSPNSIATLFFLASAGYAFFALMTIVRDSTSKLRQEYLVAVACVVFSCLFYGFMIITQNETARGALWISAYVSYFMFLPTWIRFSSSMINIKHRFTKILVRKVLIITSLLICITLIISNSVAYLFFPHGNPLSNISFFVTPLGNQFSYNHSTFFIFIAIYVFFLCICIFICHIRWWLESKTKRGRIQQQLFVVLTFLFAPLGYVTDFVIPALTDFTVTPLVSVLLFPAAMQLFISMRVNRTLNITIPAVSGFVFKSVTIPAIILDHDNIVQLENKATVDTFGKSLIGSNIADIVSLRDETSEVINFNTDIQKMIVAVNTQSGVLTCELLLTVENDKFGDALCKVAFLKDITEQENMIAEIRETSSHLELALISAETASNAKSNFLSSMSHEMRTPMNAIIGMTTIGKKSADTMSKDNALERIGEASSHLLGIINDVLDMAKIEADKLELANVPYDFDRMIKKVLSVLIFRVDEKRQVLTVDIDENMPKTLIGDDQRLAQVITNLVANAVKFTPEEGAINLEVLLTEKSADVCTLRFEVSDSGIGISQEQQKNLFSAFEQGESGISRDYGGTGLGLVISKRIVELMDGEIWVESELGHGAQFTFTVKTLYRSDEVSHEGGVSDDSPIIKGEFEGRKVLLVEDVEINRDILSALLEDTGLLIDCAENGKEAVDKITADPDKYDFVFMDLQMPLMDGLSATREIRAMSAPNIKKLPIIAMTANVFKDDIESCVAAGMNDHLGKPLDVSKVIYMLRKYLR
ncbi:MAG: ATP-binding protein [Oscillospiraceae bacterium]|nr:ATP-binding protein [Oscillospiraceae bacterium]